MATRLDYPFRVRPLIGDDGGGYLVEFSDAARLPVARCDDRGGDRKRGRRDAVMARDRT
ncbi:MAG TPA: hypothetical protein VLE23_13760 [Geminicoccaceae bacterium]|nr:hypothetical protein [Geminicoccaceae bacterium]